MRSRKPVCRVFVPDPAEIRRAVVEQDVSARYALAEEIHRGITTAVCRMAARSAAAVDIDGAVADLRGVLGLAPFRLVGENLGDYAHMERLLALDQGQTVNALIVDHARRAVDRKLGNAAPTFSFIRWLANVVGGRVGSRRMGERS